MLGTNHMNDIMTGIFMLFLFLKSLKMYKLLHTTRRMADVPCGGTWMLVMIYEVSRLRLYEMRVLKHNVENKELFAISK